MTPELWTRCPKAHQPDPNGAFWTCWECSCHGEDEDTLLRVPFDEAVQRAWPVVARTLDEVFEALTPRAARATLRPEAVLIADRVLRAALGEDT